MEDIDRLVVDIELVVVPIPVVLVVALLVKVLPVMELEFGNLVELEPIVVALVLIVRELGSAIDFMA